MLKVHIIYIDNKKLLSNIPSICFQNISLYIFSWYEVLRKSKQIFSYKYINIYRYQLIKTDFLFFTLSLFFLISYLWRIYKYSVFSKYISLHISWNLFIIFCGNDSIWGHFWYFTWFLFLKSYFGISENFLMEIRSFLGNYALPLSYW